MPSFRWPRTAPIRPIRHSRKCSSKPDILATEHYWRGDGAVRRIEFLEPLDVSLVTSRRGPYRPYGLKGGEAGALGRNTLVRADGSRELLAAQAQFRIQPGDQLLLETPGGGGWGPAAD